MTQQVVLSSTSSSFTYGWTYDVFLSFRGEDTRFSFTGNLYNSLHQRGIHTFIDHEELKRGEELTPALHKAIEESRIAIIIFSENYASSTFCLEELVKILEQENRLVWPIFYKVDPSEVRHHRESYGEALSKHQRKFKKDKEKVQKWKDALHQAANLSGWHFIKDGHEYEYRFIEEIVKEVSTKLNRTPLHIGDYPVGLESRLLEINSLLQVGSNDEVNMVGIHGIGGIGKTTTARAVYNLIADQFESLCFLGDVRDKSNSKDGLVQLQERLLFELVGDRDIKLGDVSQGITIIKRRFQKKKVLVVLDNVDRKEQLQALVGGCDWFGPGSRIIITTRDKHLLDVHGVRKTYEVKELNDDESLDLLSWNAFRGEDPDSCYLDNLKSFVEYAKGLPLALEIIGSNLHGRTIDEWKDLLCLYRRNMDEKVEGILRVSYDGLQKHEQDIFLDIACFFKGHELDYVTNMLQYTRDFPSNYSIRVLIDKSLLKIEHGCVRMHDLIQDMGKGIVRKQSPKEPGKRSRLWSYEDIVHVLEENTGTDEVEVIILKSVNNNNGYNVQWDGKAFEKMKKLKVLIIENVYFSSGVQYLPNSLRVLEWVGYPSRCLPKNFRPKKLFVLKLKESCIKSLKLERFMDLSVLNFDSCEGITQIPDISCLPNLSELSFVGCVNLVEVHDSVGSLGKLRILRACFCPNLRTLPPLAMSTLEKLRLQNCSSLEAFPDILGEKKKITELDLHDTDLVFPSSVQNLTGVRILDMQNCRRIQLPVHIAMLPELELLHIRVCRELQFSKQDEGIEKGSSIMCPKMDRLVIGHCNISDESLSLCLSWFVNVKTLNLQGSNFTILPACISKCPFLTKLDLENCKHLREIRGVPPNIQYLSAKNCTSLSSESTSILLSEELHNTGGKIFSLPQPTIPEWFDHHTKGGSISFWFRNKFPALVVCLVIGLTNEKLFYIRFDPHVMIINGNKRFHGWGHGHPFDVKADHIFVFDLRSINFEDKVEDASLEKEWNYVEISYEKASFSDLVWRSHEVSIEEVRKESGIYVLKEINQMEDIRFTNPYIDNEICSHAPSEAMISGLDSTMSSSMIRDTSSSYGDDEGNDVMRSHQDDHSQFSLCALISSVVSLCSSS